MIKKLSFIGLVLILLVLAGCGERECTYYKQVNDCEEQTTVYAIPENYLETQKIMGKISFNGDNVFLFVEEENITEPYIKETKCSKPVTRLVRVVCDWRIE